MAIEKDARANQGFKWKEAKNLAKIGQNVKVIENGTISKVENKLAVGSVEQLGITTPKYNHIDVITDSKFVRPTYNQVITLATGLTEATEVGGTWANEGPYPYDPGEGNVVYFMDSGLYYKLNGQRRYIAFGKGGALNFKATLNPICLQYTGYSLEGGFAPLFNDNIVEIDASKQPSLNIDGNIKVQKYAIYKQTYNGTFHLEFNTPVIIFTNPGSLINMAYHGFGVENPYLDISFTDAGSMGVSVLYCFGLVFVEGLEIDV